MVRITALVSAFALSLAAVQAAPNLSARQGLPDPSGAKNLGNGQGIQFIGGQCNGVADCASQCCATLPKGGQTIGVCSGPGAQFQAGKQGCGFEAGGGGSVAAAAPTAAANANSGNMNVAAPSAAPAGTTVEPSGLKPDPAGAKNVGNGNGGQFITGQCNSDADCASQCCATVNTSTDFFGICSGPGAQFQAGKQGCGFGAGGGGSVAAAANADSGSGAAAMSGNENVAAPAAAPSAAPAGTTVEPSGLKPDPAGAKNVGNSNGGQFITGQCNSDADCASQCCALVNTGTDFFGICSGPLANRQNGKQGCGFPVGGQDVAA